MARKKTVKKVAKKKATKKAAKKTVKPRAKKDAPKPRKKAAPRKKRARVVVARDILPPVTRRVVAPPSRGLPPPPKLPSLAFSTPARSITAPVKTRDSFAPVIAAPRSPVERSGKKGVLAFVSGHAGWLFAAVIGGVWLLSKRAEGAPPPLPAAPTFEPDATELPPLTIDEETEDVKPPPAKVTSSPGAPPGYVRLKNLSPSEGVPPSDVGTLAAMARDFLKFPMGHVEKFELGGKHYAAVLEEHFHPIGGPAKPWGKHKGVSLFILAEDQ